MRAALARLRRYEGSTRARLAIIASVVTFAVLAGTGASFAYWTAATTATGSAKAATLSISTANFSSVTFVHGNELSAGVGSVNFTSTTNTASTQPMTVSATFQAAAAAALANAVNVTIWQLPSGGSCAAGPTGATVSGTWGAALSISATVTSAAPTVTFCVRSVLASREAAVGAGAFTPRVSGSLSIGNFVAATAAVDTATQSARYIYPASTITRSYWHQIRPINTAATCMDVSGGGASASGTQVISWGCKTADVTNQRWQFLPSTTAGYAEIKPQNAQTLRVDGTSVTVTTDTNAVSQQWQVQAVSASVFQIVSRVNGYCLTAPAAEGDNAGSLTTAVCDNRDRQKFTITQMERMSVGAVACLNIPTSGDTSANRSVRLSWTDSSTGPYTVTMTRGATVTTLNPTAVAGSTVDITAGQAPDTGATSTAVTLTVTDADGATTTRTAVINRERPNIFSAYTYFLRCS